MRHPIDPKIDCVFKALLGSEDNRNLLLHLFNAILTQDLAAGRGPAPGRCGLCSPFKGHGCKAKSRRLGYGV